MPLIGDNRAHIQCRLHGADANRPRDLDALTIYKAYVKDGWTDRDIVREAMIALGVMVGNGWQPVHHTGTSEIHAQTYTMLQSILNIVSNLRTSGVMVGMSHENQIALENIERGAIEAASQVTFFDIGDE